MLLNESLKEHSTMQELKSTVAKQESRAAQQGDEIKVLTATLKEQAWQIQKVSAEFATASPSRGGLEATKFATGRIRRAGTRAANRPQQSVRIAVSPVKRSNLSNN
jgi:hypothetical protein